MAQRRSGKPAANRTVMVAAIAFVAVFAFLLLQSILSGPAGDRSYTLEFGPDFEPGLASRDDLGISVVVAIDASGSMSNPPVSGGAQKYIQAAAALLRVKEAIGRLARNAPPGQILKVGLIRFSDEPRTVMELTSMDAAGLARFEELATDPRLFEPEGGTAIGRTIELGARMLAQSGTLMRSLIVVTDGENTQDIAPEPVLEALYANRNSATTGDVPVYTDSTLVTFVGFDVDSGGFGGLSKLGARIASATDGPELAKVISGILEADITRLEAPSLGAGSSK